MKKITLVKSLVAMGTVFTLVACGGGNGGNGNGSKEGESEGIPSSETDAISAPESTICIVKRVWHMMCI